MHECLLGDLLTLEGWKLHCQNMLSASIFSRGLELSNTWAEQQLLFGGGLVAESCPNLTTPGTVACQAPLFIGFSRQEYWSGLPFPSPGDPPNPRIEPSSLLHCRQILYPQSFTAPFSSLLTPCLLHPHHLRLPLALGEPDLRLVSLSLLCLAKWTLSNCWCPHLSTWACCMMGKMNLVL